MNKLNPEIKDEELNQVSGGLLTVHGPTPIPVQAKCNHCGSSNVSKCPDSDKCICEDCGKTVSLPTDISTCLF